MEKLMKPIFSVSFACAIVLIYSIFLSSFNNAKPLQKQNRPLQEVVYPVKSNERIEYDLNPNWLFIDHNDLRAKEIDYDESNAKLISLPHFHASLDLFDVNKSQWEKVTWYRKHFTLPKSYKTSRVNIYFDGGGQINKIYVNGLFVGSAIGTFTHFEFDITNYISFGDVDNLIAIQVDSREHKELPPGKNKDFHFFGGLHGDAKMIIHDSLHIKNFYYHTQKQVSINQNQTYSDGDPVDLISKIEVTNFYDKELEALVRTILIDPNGKEVFVSDNIVCVPSSGTITLNTKNEVTSPILWAPDSPHLYSVKNCLFLNGTKIDEICTPIGLRWVSTTSHSGKNKGVSNPRDEQILLNDKPIVLYGINKHMQFPYVGNAGTSKLQAKDAFTIRYDLGMNFVRTAHYQNDPDFLSACDEIGLLVEEEALGWEDTPNIAQHKYSVKKMVERDYNHPSIILWSIMPNEGDEKNYPLAERKRLQEVVKELDPSRLTCQEENKALTFLTDVYNKHDYSKVGRQSPMWQPYIVGEWNTNLGEAFVIPGDSEERKVRQFLNDGLRLSQFMADQTIDGFAKWEMSGYITPNHVGKYGKNLFAYRCAGTYGVLKDPLHSYYQNDLFRSQAPASLVGNTIKIVSEWKRDSSSTVYVASNAPKVELFVGDISKGVIRPNKFNSGDSKLWQGIFKWDNISWNKNSKLKALSYDEGGNILAQELRYPSGYDVKPAKILFHNVTSNIYDSEHFKRWGKRAIENQTIWADGSDMAYLICELVDGNGERLYYGEEEIGLKLLYGDGELIYGSKLHMEDGLAGFYYRPCYGASSEVAIEASVDVGELYNQNENSFSYQGKWATKFESDPTLTTLATSSYNGDFAESSKKGDSVTIKFIGTKAFVYARSAYGYGKGIVKVDGNGAGAFNCKTGEAKYGSIGFQNIFETDTLEYGEHTIEIRASSNAPIAIDAIKVFDGKIDLSSTFSLDIKPYSGKQVPYMPSLQP